MQAGGARLRLCPWDLQHGLQPTGPGLLPPALPNMLGSGWGFFGGSTRGDKSCLIPPLHPSLSDTTG